MDFHWLFGKRAKVKCKSLDLILRSVSDSAIHLTASIIGEAGSILSRMRSTGFVGASEARVLDRIDPLATLAAKRLNGKLRLPATAPGISSGKLPRGSKTRFNPHLDAL